MRKDPQEAVRWWRKAAEQGDAGAQFRLGLACSDGRGTAKDEEEGFRWIKKSAEQGNADAEGILGAMYYAEAAPRRTHRRQQGGSDRPRCTGTATVLSWRASGICTHPVKAWRRMLRRR